MTPKIYKYIIIFLLCSGFVQSLMAQNLVPNPSFETYTVCPPGFGGGGPLQATPWQSGSVGSSDYLHECANPATVGVPVNFFGNQPANTGAAYAGGYAKYFSFLYREYLQAPLTEPMVAGVAYQIAFYISLSETSCGVANYGMYFSSSPPPFSGFLPIDVDPQFEIDMGYINEYEDWVLIQGCYLAEGGEQWITMGNFYGDPASPVDPNCPLGQLNTSYYYIDDVSIVAGPPPEEIDIDLGGPIYECFEYTIDPGIPDVSYEWEDGSTGTTLTVNESGTYAVTVTSGCDFGIDSIEVNILGVDPIDIGPEELVICPGDVYTISLDPELGDYVWNDGSTDAEYDITTPGIYSVTLDDGCQITSDFIEIFVLDPPSPFSLGDDTYLCPGQIISFLFNEDLGDFEWSDGSTFHYFDIEEEGTYALTISNMCGGESDEIDIVEIQFPVVELGPEEVTICDGEIIDIELDPSQGDYTWQDGSHELYYEITMPGTYSVVVENECGSYSDYLYVEVAPAPLVDLGDSISVCPAQLPVVLDVSNSGGITFAWNDGSSGNQLSVTQSGIYSVTVTNACGTTTDDVSVLVQNAFPAVLLPADIVACQGESITLTNSGAIGSYLWQDNSTADTLLVTAPGTYSLTVTNACGSGTDTVTVSYTAPVPTPDLGPDFTLCPGEQFTLHPGASGVSYLWQDLSVADSFVVSLPGIYSVTISDQCTSAVDSVLVTANNNPPQVDLPQQLNLCQGDMMTLDANVSGVVYQWNDGSQLATLVVTSPGLYSITVSNSCGSDVDTVIITDGGPSPFVALGNDLDLCPGETITLSPVFTNVDSWLWSNGSVTPSIDISASGTVSVQASNVCGTSYDTVIVSLLPAIPLFSLGNDTSLCTGESVTLNINATGVSILWSDGSAGNTLVASDPGVYVATISNTCGTTADTMVIDALSAIPDLDLGPDALLCPGLTLVLAPGILNVDYLWQDGSDDLTYFTDVPETIILTISNDCGSDTDTLEVIEDTDGPMIDLGPDIVACVGDAVTVTVGISGVNYLWQDGSALPSYTTTSSATLILNVSNLCGADSDTVVVDISGLPPSIDLGVDTALCSGSVLTLSASADPGTTILWQDGSSLLSYPVTSAGTYILQETNSCGVDADSVMIDFIDAPSPFTLGNDTVLCPGEFIPLLSPMTTDQLTWQDGSHAPTMIADAEQTYSLQISNECGVAFDELNLSIDINVPVVLLDPEIVWCPGELLVLDVGQSFPAVYNWNTGAQTSSITIVTEGAYAVTVTAPCAADSGGTDVQSIDDCFPKIDFYLPNVFSPDNSGINDIFQLEISEDVTLTGVQGNLFDRWGNLVFSSTAIPFAWSGDFNGQPLNPGVFCYQIQVTYVLDAKTYTEFLVGDVTLVR